MVISMAEKSGQLTRGASMILLPDSLKGFRESEWNDFLRNLVPPERASNASQLMMVSYWSFMVYRF